MRKIALLFTMCLSLLSFRSNAQVYEQGNVIIDAYYGWPNLFTSLVKTAYENSNTDYNVKIGSIGPVGAKAEYLISQRVGVGLNVNYANTTVKGSITESEYNSTTGNYEDKTYDYKGSVPRLRILPTVSIHMGSSDNLDPYFSFGVGYASMNVKEKTNDPDYVSGSVNLKAAPVTFRTEFGLRYWVSDHIGLTGQIGLGGGPLLAAGLGFKF